MQMAAQIECKLVGKTLQLSSLKRRNPQQGNACGFLGFCEGAKDRSDILPRHPKFSHDVRRRRHIPQRPDWWQTFLAPQSWKLVGSRSEFLLFPPYLLGPFQYGFDWDTEWAEGEVRDSVMVFITDDLPEATIREGVARLTL